MLDKSGYTLDEISVVGSYGYMIWLPGMFEEEGTMSALAMAESGIGGRARAEYYRKLSDQ